MRVIRKLKNHIYVPKKRHRRLSFPPCRVVVSVMSRSSHWFLFVFLLVFSSCWSATCYSTVRMTGRVALSFVGSSTPCSKRLRFRKRPRTFLTAVQSDNRKNAFAGSSSSSSSSSSATTTDSSSSHDDDGDGDRLVTTSASLQTVASHSTTTSPLSSSKKEKHFLVHQGKSADMIHRSPAIAGLTVCRNWSPDATDALIAATKSLVLQNDILSGRVYEVQSNVFAQRELWIEAGVYPADTHNFVTTIEAVLPSVPFQGMTPAQYLSSLHDDHQQRHSNKTALVSYVQEMFLPYFAGSCPLTSEQIERQLPVLQVALMVLPASDTNMSTEGEFSSSAASSSITTTTSTSWAVYSLSMSHAAGDGVTFFQLLKQLSLLMNQQQHQHNIEIDWMTPMQGKHEFFPTSLSMRDVEISYGLPFFVGLVKNAILTWSKRKPTILLLDKAAVKRKKMELRHQVNNNTLSSNDVVVTALCQAAPSMDVFIFTENARNNVTIPLNAGGNFLWEIPISAQAVIDNPLCLRDAIQSKAYYPTNQVPAQPYWCGKVGRLTSLATITEQVVYDDVEAVCTIPIPFFLNNIPMDVALIFRYNKEYLGVLHNFADLQVHDSPLLEAILVTD